MTIVDSNTWADFFNGALNPHSRRLDDALKDREDLGVSPIIITEVLQGFRTENGFQARRRRPPAVICDPAGPGLPCTGRPAVPLASATRGHRARAVDCVIAQLCLDTDVMLLSPDADFENIARHTSLRLWRSG